MWFINRYFHVHNMNANVVRRVIPLLGLRTAVRIFIRFGMNFMLLEVTSITYFLIFDNRLLSNLHSHIKRRTIEDVREWGA
jgi:hypothetical protein